jgi:hypothetical protein
MGCGYSPFLFEKAILLYMEEFKIITLPTKDQEETSDKEPVIEEKIEDDDYTPPKKRYFVIVFLLLLAIGAFFVIKMTTCYEDYEVEKKWERKDSAESSYYSYNNNLLKVSADGIFHTAYDGTLIWNYTYDMTNPSIDISGDYIIVFDKKGTEVDIFSSKGFVKNLTTTTPIVDAKVASQGTVALMLEENTTSYIQMFDKNGDLLVSGELHHESSGFPVSMALSSDATRLLLSIINVDDGEISTKLVFYDFTSRGKEEQDNIAASHQYIGALIPKVDFVSKDKAIAFSDSRIIIFNNNYKATVAKDISVPSEMKSIFYNDTHFGYICETATEGGTVVDQLNVYNLFGFRCISKPIDSSYANIQILDNNEIYINNGKEATLYNLQGFKKFTYTFEDVVYNLLPGATSKRYYLIGENKTEEIYLK